MEKLSALREILRYVPTYRRQVFVVSVDGEMVADENFANVLLDIALLRSLNIYVVLVHGASHQIRATAAEKKIAISNDDGAGVTDAATLELAINAANRITHDILEGLTTCDLRGACPNVLVAHPAGILKGVDMGHTGKVERVDAEYLQLLMEQGVVPVIPPLGFDGEGRSFRLNSDAAAAELALALKAIKLVFITPHEGIARNGKLLRQLSVNEAEELLKKDRAHLVPKMISKLEHAWKACAGGISRVHIISGRMDEGLLAEVFSASGVGTLVYMNEYQSIRPARKRDARTILKLIKHGVDAEELVKRTRTSIEKQIGDYYLYEIDGNPAGCIALHAFPDSSKGELACLAVDDAYGNRGIGRKLMNFVEKTAREKGLKTLFLLSTQTFNYFQQKGGFQEAGPEDLPPARRKAWEESKRNSRVLLKHLGQMAKAV